MKKNLSWLAVLLPILVMLGWVAKIELMRARGVEVTLNIQGYDPRDLLSGHYLRYSVNYGKSICEKIGDAGAFCVCLGQSAPGEPNPVQWSGRCEERNESSCPLFIKGTCRWGRLEANIERYYFPEEFGKELLVIPPNATIRAKVSSDGSAQVTAMHVSGVEILEYARRQKEKRN